jgi:hypothetical protein
MLVHYRHRRGMYPLSPRPASRLRTTIAAVLLVLFLYFFGSWLLRMFGLIAPVIQEPAMLTVEDRGIVSVTIEGGETKRAENQMKLFPGEKLSTGPGGFASLQFFEGTITRADENTDVTILKSTQGKDITLSLQLNKGRLWLLVPSSKASSGAVVRTVETPLIRYIVPPGTEAVLSPSGLLVYRAEGMGISLAFKGKDPVTVGEGQKLLLPISNGKITTLASSLYAYRSPLEPSTFPFLDDSRKTWKTPQSINGTAASATESGEVLTVTTPADNSIATKNVVSVTGMFGDTVDTVKVNGYGAALDKDNHTFTQDVSIPDGVTPFDVRIQAFDKSQNSIAEIHRLVKRDKSTANVLPSPVITSPAASGQTYQTQKDEIIIRGTSPSQAASITVNGYKLQLFDPSKGSWSYLASTRLGNMQSGTNIFDVVATDEGGDKSPPARITIVVGEGTEGIISGGNSSASSGKASSAGLDPRTLPKNAPLTPGILKVTGDPALPDFIATGTGFILEGKTTTNTATMWVNDYQLKLYKPGKDFWNYIASPDLKTLKSGKNVFHIVARNAKGEILDALDFTVTYQK